HRCLGVPEGDHHGAPRVGRARLHGHPLLERARPRRPLRRLRRARPVRERAPDLLPRVPLASLRYGFFSASLTRSSRRRILPVTVLGSSSTSSTKRGYL